MPYLPCRLITPVGRAYCCGRAGNGGNRLSARAFRIRVIPARVQVSGNVIIDGAQIPAALAELRKPSKKYYGNTDITVVTAIMRDKDVFGAVFKLNTWQIGNLYLCK